MLESFSSIQLPLSIPFHHPSQIPFSVLNMALYLHHAEVGLRRNLLVGLFLQVEQSYALLLLAVQVLQRLGQGAQFFIPVQVNGYPGCFIWGC